MLNPTKIIMLMMCLVIAPQLVYATALSWHFQGLTPRTQALLAGLEEQQVFLRMSQTLQNHLQLEKPIHMVFYPGAEAFFDPQRDEMLIPLSVLQRMRHDVEQRFPLQDEVQNAVYMAAVENLLWHQLARVVVSQYQLPVGGDAEHSIDAFATLAMLDSKQGINQLYLLDATETFLLSMPAFQLWGELSSRSPAEQVEARYRLAVCLVLGEDHLQYPELVSELTWQQESLDACKQRLQAARQAWSGLLSSLLHEWSPWRNWGQVRPRLQAE